VSIEASAIYRAGRPPLVSGYFCGLPLNASRDRACAAAVNAAAPGLDQYGGNGTRGSVEPRALRVGAEVVLEHARGVGGEVVHAHALVRLDHDLEALLELR